MKQKTGKIRKYAKRRHKFYFKLARPIAAIIARKMGFKYKKFPLKKGDAYFILGNHQTDMDPVFVALSFDAPVYFVAGDNIFNGSVPSKMLSHCFAPIKKRKGVADLECIRNCLKAAKEGHCICIFPEGNRAWPSLSSRPPIFNRERRRPLTNRTLDIKTVSFQQPAGHLSHRAICADIQYPGQKVTALKNNGPAQ